MTHISWVFAVLALSLTVSHGSMVYMISPSNRIASCQPVTNCFTLSQFAANSKVYIKQNTTLMLQPGIHTLNSEFIISNVSHFSMKTMSPSTVNIVCTQTGKVTLESVQVVHIEGLDFIHCAGNKASHINHLKLTRLNFTGPSLSATGTALELNNTNAFVSHCSYSSYLYGSFRPISSQFQHSYSLTESVAWTGGALIAIGSNVTIYRSSFKGNRAQLGGALYIMTSNVTITNSDFDFNTANSSHSSVTAGGSAIFAINATIFVHSTTFTKNSVYYGKTMGGAISSIHSKLTLSHSLIKDNRVIDKGGALHAFSSNIIIIKCTCYRNKANIGGAVAVNTSNLTIINSVIGKSQVSTNGGAIFVIQSVVLIQSSSIKDNFAQVGGAVFSSTSLITIRQSILSRNKAVKDGGTIYCNDNCDIHAKESFFISNNVEQKGGVIRADNKCQVTVTHCRFMNNTASNGGVLSVGPSDNVINVTKSIFQYNMAYSKGGVVVTYNSLLHMTNSSFISNRAFVGGVIAIESNSSFVSNSCFFSSNSAIRGGVLNSVESRASFVNVSIISNVARKGVILLVTSNVTFTSLTIIRANIGSFTATNSSLRFFGYTLFKDNSVHSSITPQYGGALTLIHSNLLFGGPKFIFVNNSALYGGAINANTSMISSTGQVLAVKNVAKSSGGAMYLLRSELQCAGKMKFSGNVAMKRGGAVDSLNSSMTLHSNCSLSFENNFAAAGDDIIMDTN